MLRGSRQQNEKDNDKLTTFSPITESSGTKATIEALKLQLTAISQLCLQALAEPNLSTLITRTVALVCQGLQVEYCSILELLPEYKKPRLRASVGFNEVIEREPAMKQKPLARYTLRFRQVTAAEDWHKEMRFDYSPISEEYGTLHDVSTVIKGIDKPFGILTIYTSRADTFTQDEIDFIETIARILTAALSRQQTESQVVAKKLNKLQNNFLNAVSDELRAPICNMKMVLQMLVKNLDRDHNFPAELSKLNTQNSKVARYFKILLNECERELKLVDDLLDLQRLAAKTYPNFLYESISLPEWIAPILESLHARVQQHQKTLSTNFSPELPNLVTEPTLLKRILLELLDSACKYTPPGETITISADVVKEKLRISVSSSGVEIPVQERDHIFEKFYPIPHKDCRKQGGLGLGLALVKQLVEKLGGTIELEDSVGQTTLAIQFPTKSYTNSP